MTNEVVIRAASYMTPDGYGSSTLGRRPWLDAEGKPCKRSDLMSLSWSSMFAAPCPRFGRMSSLTRLGLMTVELLDAGFAGMTEAQRTDTGLCMLSPCGSLETDIDFLREISPGTFTYTLPSSVIGEVCIRHRLRGPGLCLMSAEENAGRGIVEEACERIAMGEAEAMVCLLCDAPGPDARNILNSALDMQDGICWYSHGLYLVRKDTAQGLEQAADTGVPASGADIRRISLDLCT